MAHRFRVLGRDGQVRGLDKNAATIRDWHADPEVWAFLHRDVAPAAPAPRQPGPRTENAPESGA